MGIEAASVAVARRLEYIRSWGMFKPLAAA
jgi:hypothetical protein